MKRHPSIKLDDISGGEELLRILKPFKEENKMKKYTQKELNKILQMRVEGKKVADIAKALKRSPESIYQKIHAMKNKMSDNAPPVLKEVLKDINFELPKIDLSPDNSSIKPAQEINNLLWYTLAAIAVACVAVYFAVM